MPWCSGCRSLESICGERRVLLKDPGTFFHGLRVSGGCGIFAYLGLKLVTPNPASYPGVFLPPFKLLSADRGYLSSHICLPGLWVLFLCPQHSSFLFQRRRSPKASSRDWKRCGREQHFRQMLATKTIALAIAYNTGSWAQWLTSASSTCGRLRQED